MKLVIAPDSFKESISAYGACEAIKRGILEVMPAANVICKPIADGGEGTLDALIPSEQQTRLSVTGPSFKPVTARYGNIGDIAIIEMASAAGLMLVSESEKKAGAATTYGVGEIIRDAVSKGYKKIMLTVGGSATNDGGCGMLAALGARFTDVNGKEFIPTGYTLNNISAIDLSGVLKEILDCEFIIATDVKNPLLGNSGATYVYATQKGAQAEELPKMEAGMKHYAELLKSLSGRDVAEINGCGAGGGLSAPLLAFFNARIQSGIDTVLDITDFDSALLDADAVITGEGKIDSQSLYGKAISGVAKRANAAKTPVYCFVGCIGDDPNKLKAMGIADIFDILSLADSSDDAMKNADKYLYSMARTFALNASKNKE